MQYYLDHAGSDIEQCDAREKEKSYVLTHNVDCKHVYTQYDRWIIANMYQRIRIDRVPFGVDIVLDIIE